MYVHAVGKVEVGITSVCAICDKVRAYLKPVNIWLQ